MIDPDVYEYLHPELDGSPCDGCDRDGSDYCEDQCLFGHLRRRK
jgi:hypothetical protein